MTETAANSARSVEDGGVGDGKQGNNNLYNVDKIVIHQQYDPRSHLHDIAVVWLDRTIQFSPIVQRICLPPPSLPSLEDRTAFVAGWSGVTLSISFSLYNY